MPETFLLDDPPTDDATATSADEDGRVQCPECTLTFKPSGIKRHITMSHRGGVSDSPSSTSSSAKGIPKGGDRLAERWAQFQVGIAMPVSLACTQCGLALAEDAEVDGKAIATFCVNKPKLKKQIDDFLASTDFIMLIGALGGTAKKMVSHHSIAKKLPFGASGIAVEPNPEHQGHNPTERMMAFMGGLPEEQRNQMMNEAFKHAKTVAEATRAAQPVPDPTPTGAGAEPVPDALLTDRDKQIAVAMGGYVDANQN
jgi:hypothetical protein